jgi:protein-tyrosine-phosphatase
MNASGKRPVAAQRLLFVCVHNKGRSQMAEAFTRQLSGGRVVADSAGTRPSSRLDPVVVEAMRERGIDITKHRPKLITDEMVGRADRVFTMGCFNDTECPAVILKKSVDWALEDPHGKPLAEVRRIRDDVEQRVRGLLKEMQIL